MTVLIHACPKRMWYVEGFLLPELERQGADEVEVWNDTEGCLLHTPPSPRDRQKSRMPSSA